MSKTIVRVIKLGAGALIFSSLLGNSGCLVDEGSDVREPNLISQSTLRIYRPGNEIRYDVQYDVYRGTLITRWDLPVGDEIVYIDPRNNESLPIPGLLKETSVLNLNSPDSVPITVVRYISQDSEPGSPTYGKMTIHAYDSAAGPVQHNYVHSATFLGPTDADPIVPATILPSPLPLDSNFNPLPAQVDFPIIYYVYPCNTTSNTCSPYNQAVNETMQLSGMTKIILETTLDSFEALQIPFGGNISYQSGVAAPVPLDIRAFCGDPTEINLAYNGNQWIYPAIGIVRYEITCLSGTGTKVIAATLSRVSFAY